MSVYRRLASFLALSSLVVATPHIAVAQEREYVQFSIEGLFPVAPAVLTDFDAARLVITTNTIVARLINEQRKTTLDVAHALEWRKRTLLPTYEDGGPLWNFLNLGPSKPPETTPGGRCKTCDISKYIAMYHHQQVNDRPLP
jgi:hypothetical protein